MNIGIGIANTGLNFNDPNNSVNVLNVNQFVAGLLAFNQSLATNSASGSATTVTGCGNRCRKRLEDQDKPDRLTRRDPASRAWSEHRSSPGPIRPGLLRVRGSAPAEHRLHPEPPGGPHQPIRVAWPSQKGSRSWRFWILPDAERGISSMRDEIDRGTL